MRRSLSPLLLAGGVAAVLASGLLGVWWLPGRASAPEVAAGAAASPPPAAAASAEADLCAALLRRDPEEAGRFALEWARRGGGEAAERCIALALIAIGNPERGAARLEALAADSGSPPDQRAALYAEAVQGWMLAGDPARAYAAATLGLSLVPQDAGLLLDRALAAGSLGRFAEALADLDRALALEPRRAEAWVFRASALRQLQRPAEAREAVDRALELDPDHPEGLLERGILRQAAGDAEGARADWQRLLAVAPDSAAADLAAQNLELLGAGPAAR
jgi:tetratricopeptide (TPR) repeat protein